MKNPEPQRTWWRPLLGTLAIFVVIGVAMAYLFFVQWTSAIPVAPTEVEQVFSAAAREAGGEAPYVEISEEGVVVVHREQEEAHPTKFGMLTIMLWVPHEDEVLRVDVPRWFVRLKTATSFNLGTMISIWRKDWAHLDLDITFDDLARRGPALLLDHRTKTGARILLWTSAEGH